MVWGTVAISRYYNSSKLWIINIKNTAGYQYTETEHCLQGGAPGTAVATSCLQGHPPETYITARPPAEKEQVSGELQAASSISGSCFGMRRSVPWKYPFHSIARYRHLVGELPPAARGSALQMQPCWLQGSFARQAHSSACITVSI